MKFNEILEFLNSIGSSFNLTTGQMKELINIGHLFGLETPHCTCNGKFRELIISLKYLTKGLNDFPKYRWVSKRARFKFEDTILSSMNHPDDIVEKYIKENPDQTDFELWKKEEVSEKPKKKKKNDKQD